MGIIISTHDCPQEVRNKLRRSLGVKFIIIENESRGYTLFEIDSGEAIKLQSLKILLANIVGEVVIESLEEKIINQIIRHRYHQFDPAQRLEIKKFSQEHLDKCYNPGDALVARLSRKREIISRLIAFWKQSHELNIEGFVRFRLKDYTEQLRQAVERAVDDFIIEREYREFLELLRYFVEIQEPRVDLVNVLKDEKGGFQILDEQGQVINNDYLKGHMAELMEGKVEFEDLLVSALINISPARIVLHFQDDGVTRALEGIFQERVEICPGCPLCKLT